MYGAEIRKKVLFQYHKAGSNILILPQSEIKKNVLVIREHTCNHSVNLTSRITTGPHFKLRTDIQLLVIDRDQTSREFCGIQSLLKSLS